MPPASFTIEESPFSERLLLLRVYSYLLYNWDFRFKAPISAVVRRFHVVRPRGARSSGFRSSRMIADPQVVILRHLEEVIVYKCQ